jgi:hypothetical protein
MMIHGSHLGVRGIFGDAADNAIGPTSPDGPDVVSSERNKFGRPYPWYCGLWQGFSEECAPPAVKQIQDEADAAIMRKVEEGKLNPALAAEGIARGRAAVEADCAARPADCANLDAFSESVTCSSVLGPELCDSLRGKNNNLLYIVGGITAVALLVILVKR